MTIRQCIIMMIVFFIVLGIGLLTFIGIRSYRIIHHPKNYTKTVPIQGKQIGSIRYQGNDVPVYEVLGEEQVPNHALKLFETHLMLIPVLLVGVLIRMGFKDLADEKKESTPED